jgi:hypothetical protein
MKYGTSLTAANIFTIVAGSFKIRLTESLSIEIIQIEVKPLFIYMFCFSHIPGKGAGCNRLINSPSRTKIYIDHQTLQTWISMYDSIQLLEKLGLKADMPFVICRI